MENRIRHGHSQPRVASNTKIQVRNAPVRGERGALRTPRKKRGSKTSNRNKGQEARETRERRRRERAKEARQRNKEKQSRPRKPEDRNQKPKPRKAGPGKDPRQDTNGGQARGRRKEAEGKQNRNQGPRQQDPARTPGNHTARATCKTNQTTIGAIKDDGAGRRSIHFDATEGEPGSRAPQEPRTRKRTNGNRARPGDHQPNQRATQPRGPSTPRTRGTRNQPTAPRATKQPKTTQATRDKWEGMRASRSVRVNRPDATARKVDVTKH